MNNLSVLKFKSLKSIFCLIIFLIGTTDSFAHYGMSAKAVGIKGRVKTVIKSYEGKKGGGKTIGFITRYDRQGNVIDEIHYSAPPEKKTIPVIKIVSSIQNSIKTAAIYHRFDYDDTNYSKKVTEQAIIKIFETENRIEETWFDGTVETGKKSFTIEYLLDKYQRIVEEQLQHEHSVEHFSAPPLVEKSDIIINSLYKEPFPEDVDKPSRTIYKFNDDGILTERAETSWTGRLYQKFIYSNFKVDKTGNWTERNVQVINADMKQNHSLKEYRKISYYSSTK